MENWVASCSVIFFMSSFVACTYTLKKMYNLNPALSRKMAHLYIGTTHLLFLPYYDDTLAGRLWSIFGVALLGYIFYFCGIKKRDGILADLIYAPICRHNSCKELLGGPVVYCVSMTVETLIFWRSYPPSIIGLMVMITGDGLAEIAGKNIRSKVFLNPWEHPKTVAGCTAIFLGGALGSILMCYYMFGQFYVYQSFIGGFVGVFVEFYSPPDLDNFIIPIPIIIVEHFLI